MEKILDVVDVAEYGAKTAVADTMKIAFKSAKRLTLAGGEGKNKVEMAKKKKKKDIGDTKWPQQIKEFCLTKPVCRECPGVSVSIGYGERAEKFIRGIRKGEAHLPVGHEGDYQQAVPSEGVVKYSICPFVCCVSHIDMN